MAERAEAIKNAALAKSLEEEQLDVTLPGRTVHMGRLHPSTQQLRRVLDILAEMGFQVYTSREVETDEMNFQLLNFPPHHPAREMQDTFFVEAGDRGDNPIMLRTHTSPGQIRAMREFAAMNPDNPPPIRIALPGMCFRYEQITARSEIQFNQVEGLVVGENITFADLKGTLIDFARRMFGQNVAHALPRRLLPVHRTLRRDGCGVFCVRRQGLPGLQELRLAGDPGLRHGPSRSCCRTAATIPQRYSGFAWGMGPERQLMLRYESTTSAISGATTSGSWSSSRKDRYSRIEIDIDMAKV